MSTDERLERLERRVAVLEALVRGSRQTEAAETEPVREEIKTTPVVPPPSIAAASLGSTVSGTAQDPKACPTSLKTIRTRPISTCLVAAPSSSSSLPPASGAASECWPAGSSRQRPLKSSGADKRPSTSYGRKSISVNALPLPATKSPAMP